MRYFLNLLYLKKEMTRQDIRDIVNKTTHSWEGKLHELDGVMCYVTDLRKPKFVQPRIPTARTSSTLYTN